MEAVAAPPPEQRLAVSLRIVNRAERDVAIDGITYALDINGREFASGVFTQKVTVPGYGETTVAIPIAGTPSAKAPPRRRCPAAHIGVGRGGGAFHVPAPWQGEHEPLRRDVRHAVGVTGPGTGQARRVTPPAPRHVSPRSRRPPPTTPRARSRVALREGFDRHYALFRDCARAAKRHFEAGNWLAIQHVGARPHRLLRPPRAGDRRAHRARVPLRRPRRRRRRRAVGAGQAPLHRPADRPQAAGVRGDVLQLGVVQDPAPRRTSTTASSSCGRRSPPSTSTPTRRPIAATTRCSRACAHALIDIVLDFRLRAPLRRFPARPAQRAARRSASAFRGRSASRPITRSRCCRRRSSATRPPTSSAASSTASTPTRSSSPLKHDAGRPALRRRAADGRGRARAPVLGQPRVLPGRHGGAVGVRRLPARDAAGQDRRRALHDGRAAEGRQEPLLPRLPAPPRALARPLHHRARASRAS